MNTKQVFIILVATLFLAVLIGGSQAENKIKSTKSNASEISAPSTGGTSNSSPNDAKTINTTRSNTFRGQGKAPKTDSINLNSSRSN